MSEEAHAPRARQEPDRPDVKALVAVAIGVLLVFGGCVVAIVFLLKAREAAFLPHGSPPAPLELHQPEIGMVNQRPFGEQPEEAEIRRRAAVRLTSYGWVDPDAGLVRLPLDRALQLAAQGVRP